MAVDVSKVDYSLILLTPDGREITIDNLLLNASLEENGGELAARLQVLMKNIKRADGWIHQHVYLARRLILKATDGNGWNEIFRGSVYRWKTIAKDHTIEFTAYDPLYPLQQSKDHWYFSSGETGASSIKKIASKWGIAVGRIDGPHVKLSKKPYSNNTLGDIIADRLKESKDKGSGRFIVRSNKGKLECVKEASNSVIYILDDNYVEDSSDERSIENLVTRVKIYGNEDKEGRATLKATKDGETKFGIIQEVVYSDAYENLNDAKKAADEILKEDGKPKVERVLTGPDIPWIRKGDMVEVMTGTIGSSRNGVSVPISCVVESVSRDISEKRITLFLRG